MNRIYWYCENIAIRDVLFKFPFLNINQAPKFKSINLNLMTKTAILDKKKMFPLLSGLEMISGQKSKRTYAKKSIATFKLRAGQLLGASCTLRKKQMYEFLDKFSFIVLPKVRDFQGFFCKDSHSFNCPGQSFLLYPELENHYEYFEIVKGFQISLAFYSKKKRIFLTPPISIKHYDLKKGSEMIQLNFQKNTGLRKIKLEQKLINQTLLRSFIPV